MIKVYYSGFGYIERCNNRIVDFFLMMQTHRHYSNYFFIEADIVGIWEHFGNFTIRDLRFIDDNLPHSITKDMTHDSVFALTSQSYKWHTPFELIKGQSVYKDKFGNALRIIFDDDEPLDDGSLSTAEKQDIATQLPKDEWLESIVFEIGFYQTLPKTNGENSTIDWWHWLILTEWTKEQAAYLICGIDPNDDDLSKFPEPVKKIIQRCDGELKHDHAPILVWLRWFDDIGLLDRHSPKKLIDWYHEKQLEKLNEQSAVDLEPPPIDSNAPLDDTKSPSTDDPSENHTTAPPVRHDVTPKEKTKLEKQHAAILAAIKQLGFDPMAIPDGGKGIIEDICRANYPSLFDGVTSFENAWKKRGCLFRMENHDSFAKRGK